MSAKDRMKRRELLRAQNAGHGRFGNQARLRMTSACSSSNVDDTSPVQYAYYRHAGTMCCMRVQQPSTCRTTASDPAAAGGPLSRTCAAGLGGEMDDSNESALEASPEQGQEEEKNHSDQPALEAFSKWRITFL